MKVEKLFLLSGRILKVGVPKKMRYTKSYKRKQAILRELRNYKGNKKLFEEYQSVILGEKHDEYNLLVCRKELLRVHGNMQYVHDIVEYLPHKDKEFLLDVFVHENLSHAEILKKYELTTALLNYYTDKCASVLADMDIY